jgi:hypothetical protein
MYVANPIDPSFPTIRYLSELGPSSRYPRADGYPFDGTASASGSRRRQRGQLSAVAGIVLAAAAFGAGFLGGFTAAAPMPGVERAAQGPIPGEFRLGPGNLTPPGIVMPLHGAAMPGEFRLGPGNMTPPGIVVPLD